MSNFPVKNIICLANPTRDRMSPTAGSLTLKEREKKMKRAMSSLLSCTIEQLQDYFILSHENHENNEKIMRNDDIYLSCIDIDF